ncbi:23S rRNA pseudouridine2604 synthase [Butyrivibrio sp. ob235]|uniref:pseudouridine synthase n=1 Tax=Butyrivibrio sp. ob235 TaxID=1761780 RepID=UPI0008D44E94|nr:pseudouridine synthase [Butyrivibrio sp. ob235]SEK42376.1 23S rRNA pseudouridine2604 synthase [Butyrivibrio sp. ob235]
MEEIRLNKYIAMCGVCSRRDADKLIEEGRITVNGKPAQCGMKVSDEDEILCDGVLISRFGDKIVIAYNKPVGVVCTEKDEHAERTIIEDLGFDRRVTYAGRLDKDSEGLMILTNDGDLIQAMMKSRNGHEKEYVVEVDKSITEKFLTDMEKGVYLKELDKTTRPCKVKKISESCFRIILTQGLNRQIRRMCDAFGYYVVRLKRVRILNIELGELGHSEHRMIEGDELKMLYELARKN